MRSDLRFTEEYVWIRLEDDIATIGVSEHAQEELGEIVFVELPKLNKQVCQMDEVDDLMTSEEYQAFLDNQ